LLRLKLKSSYKIKKKYTKKFIVNLFLHFKNILEKNLIFLFSNCFNVLLKVNFINKKYYFNIFLNKNIF